MLSNFTATYESRIKDLGGTGIYHLPPSTQNQISKHPDDTVPVQEIQIKLKVCPKCRRAFYPSFYKNGIIFVHNKFMLTIEAILDLGQILSTGGGFLATVKEKLLLLGHLEGLEIGVLEKNLDNNALALEKMVIATLSIILKGSDLDSVVCYICGNCPKIVCTDGNSKVYMIKVHLSNHDSPLGVE